MDLLTKTLYRLKQAARTWNQVFDIVLNSFRFQKTFEGALPYAIQSRVTIVIIVVYVDDVLRTGDILEEIEIAEKKRRDRF